AGVAAHAADEEADEAELLALVEAVQQAYEESGELPNDPGPRLVRREEIPLPTGHHPARGNLPSSRPRRHLRAVQENDRSEERRVGKECRCRRWPTHQLDK